MKAVEIIAKAKGSVEGLRKEFLRHEEAHGKNAPVAIKYEDIPTSLVAINDALDIAARKAEDARPDPDEDQGRGGGFVIGEFDQQW